MILSQGYIMHPSKRPCPGDLQSRRCCLPRSTTCTYLTKAVLHEINLSPAKTIECLHHDASARPVPLRSPAHIEDALQKSAATTSTAVDGKPIRGT